ncbi:MAG: hypothetical protein GXP31_16250 [Kiritimatiellaeota bacterium]|nr:hypothetical protein [Kiritimatiellota bacterium]
MNVGTARGGHCGRDVRTGVRWRTCPRLEDVCFDWDAVRADPSGDLTTGVVQGMVCGGTPKKHDNKGPQA